MTIPDYKAKTDYRNIILEIFGLPNILLVVPSLVVYEHLVPELKYLLFLYRFSKKALNRLSSNFLRAHQSGGIGYPGRFRVNPQKSAFRGSNTWRRWSKPEK